MLTEKITRPDGTEYERNKVDVAVARIRETYETYRRSPELGGGLPLWIGYSGGKDSSVILELVKRAGVPYEANYSITTVDPPELVQFIKSQPEVKRNQARRKDGTPITMWNAIAYHLIPPTRIIRYCCRELKESFGRGRITVTGVRWEESARRKKGWSGLNFYGKRAQKQADKIGADYWDSGNEKTPRLHFDFGEDSNEVFLNNDNDTMRKMTEHCVPKGKVILNPIIDWTEEDVWEFIHTENIPYCHLYDEGRSRLGCIGCPMNTSRIKDLEHWPKYKEAYLKAFDKVITLRKEKGLEPLGKEWGGWKTPEEVMDWWVSNSRKPKEVENERN